VRCGADHFAVAALFWDHMINMFKLTVFSSATGAWTTRVAPLEEPSSLPCEPEVLNFQPTKVIPLKGSILVLNFQPTKVIPLKGSILGWVDVWSGILLCDVLSEDPKLRYIPMPEPMPGNESFEDEGEPAFFRDVIGCGEVIKFIEVDYYENDDDDDTE
jgi:hypothetical protein